MSKLASATISGGASAQHNRHESDYYETPEEATIALMRHLPDWRTRNTWEPACGDGMMVRALEKMTPGYKVLATDIRTTPITLGGVDFLRTACAPLAMQQVITNPPFDKAVEFIRHARSFKMPFAMLLKSTFWHAAKRRALFVETGPIKVLPLGWRPAMAPDRGEAPTMEFSWTVWDAYPSAVCEYYPLVKP